MSSGVFRGKESSNRIKLSQLVQDLLNFGVLGSLQLWGGGRWMGGIWGHGSVPTHVHMHMHARTCMHTHVYMYRNCKWLPTWRLPCLSCLSCLTCMCMCTCMHAHVCVHITPPYTLIPTPTPFHPPTTPQGGSPQNQ